MPPYTKLPRPEGTIYFSYNPMSPPNWGIVPFDIHVFVYRDVRVALQALMQAATTIQAQRLESGIASLLADHLYFRGQSEVTQRLLPTRLRGPRRQSEPRQRFRVDHPPKVKFRGVEFPSVAFESGGEDPRNHWGDWFERVEAMRSIEDSTAEVPDDELRRRDALELDAVTRASRVPDVARLDDFRKRAAVRHYSGAPSGLLDVSTDPEVAAFFATGASKPAAAGKIGMLWAIDLNFFAGLFSYQITSVPGGLKIGMSEQRENWGVNKQMFERFGALPAHLQLVSIELPFQRPQAQRARFFSLSGEGGQPLPSFTQLTWWSIIERRAYACAFIQDGHTYENPSHNITNTALLPNNEKLAIALA